MIVAGITTYLPMELARIDIDVGGASSFRTSQLHTQLSSKVGPRNHCESSSSQFPDCKCSI